MSHDLVPSRYISSPALIVSTFARLEWVSGNETVVHAHAVTVCPMKVNLLTNLSGSNFPGSVQ